MYRGFQYEATRVDNELIRLAKNSYDKHKGIVKESLSEYLQENKALNGTKMMDDWFPQIECDVFISHSHADLEEALTFAGWLLKHFNLTSFIDSCVWGSAQELQEKIDDEYCYIDRTNTYDYYGVMFSTSHIHMMLASSLTMMIDRAECIFFLNTPNSLPVSNINSKTRSPWIYHELTIGKYIQKRPLGPDRGTRRIIMKAFKDIEYELDLSPFTKVTEDGLMKWERCCSSSNATGTTALDFLYQLHPERKHE